MLASKTGAGVNNYLIDRVTINAGDSVAWNGKSLANGFHSVDIPALGGSDLPLILPTGKTVTGVLDAAGNPFWFNGGVPQLVDRTKAQSGSVSLGASGPGGLEVFQMFPAVLHVAPGTTVKFFMSKDTRETHTATFGPVSYLKPLAKAFGGPVPPPQGIYPSDPPGHIVLTPTTHGNGFAGIGALDRDSATPLAASSTITFSTPGTYQFICWSTRSCAAR